MQLKSPTELAKMRQAGRLVAGALRVIADMARPGVTTEELDRAAAGYIEERGARASFKGYRGFPASICASLNEEVVHGIPGSRKLREGDLLKADVGVLWQGYHADAAVTIGIGPVAPSAQELMRVTRAALDAAIQAAMPGRPLSDVCGAIQRTAESAGFSVVTEYTGHGIGRGLHEDPKVPNYVSSWARRRGDVLQKGVTLAIEPMINEGTGRTEVLADGWTVVTKDRRLSAHFEHTVAVDEGGAVILTLP